MPRELAQIIKEAFPRLSEISQQVGGNFSESDNEMVGYINLRSRKSVVSIF